MPIVTTEPGSASPPTHSCSVEYSRSAGTEDMKTPFHAVWMELRLATRLASTTVALSRSWFRSDRAHQHLEPYRQPRLKGAPSPSRRARRALVRARLMRPSPPDDHP